MYNSYGVVPVSNYLECQNMIKLDDIIEAYLCARTNKRKSPDQVEFEIHWERNCVRLYEDIINHTLRPTAYTFVCQKPKPREVFASDMSTRILHHYLDIRLRPLLEKRLSPHTFNNRVGMGQDACQNAVISDIYEVSEGYTQDCYITKIDIQGCFPNISQDIAHKQLEEIVLNDYVGADKDELIYILQVCIFSYPTEHCYRKSSLDKWKYIVPSKSLFTKPRGTGAAIGHLIWQNAVNYYFHEIDEWMDSMGICYERYVDDFYIISRTKGILLLIPELRRRLAELGATLHPYKFYHQHYSKGVECLGSHIKIDRIYPNKRILKNAKEHIVQLNRCARENKVYLFISSINSYLGICKNRNGFARAYDLINTISPKWWEYVTFNRRRVCLQPKPRYKERNVIIHKFNLLSHDKNRNPRFN